ncbi:unnamed protein product [Polarella glacialis]|uniref:Carboxylesterase type B domain-containing protein n=1 Tax=Polarella glacialis TaxID=89957 RepID=A0A813DF31_POLGL|nr:unnamed protein product [Polarella glacialis]CAE8648518.1 unnamed protein product [Polarella glacialis]
MQLDLMQAGWDSRDSKEAAILSALQMVVDRRAAGSHCSELPVTLAAHAWRYNQGQLLSCFALGNSSGQVDTAACSMSCQFLPAVSIQLRCTAAGLVGQAPEGECRHVRDTAIVETTGGSVRGLLRPTLWLAPGERQPSVMLTRSFWGLPYADPPERFRAPRPLSSKWQGIQDLPDYYAEGFSPKTHCAGNAPLDDGKGSEDCLYLDVYTPPHASAESPMPVLVFLFGGGFVAGDAWQNGHFDGIRRAVDESVVLVVVSMRTGYLGHLWLPSLRMAALGIMLSRTSGWHSAGYRPTSRASGAILGA